MIRNPNVKFLDYHFDVAPNGTIIMDKELTLKHINASVGDLLIVMFEDDRIKFVPCDVRDAIEDNLEEKG
jgi:hypothetical protein